jgi:hypothetical protein
MVGGERCHRGADLDCGIAQYESGNLMQAGFPGLELFLQTVLHKISATPEAGRVAAVLRC